MDSGCPTSIEFPDGTQIKETYLRVLASICILLHLTNQIGTKHWALKRVCSCHMGVSINWGSPRWLVYNGKSIYKWMMK
jgi:hypothetical protein